MPKRKTVRETPTLGKPFISSREPDFDDFDYRGYGINEVDDCFQVGRIQFESFDAALDWIDDELDYLPEPAPPKLHKYIIFYVDRATDRCFEAVIDGYTYNEAEATLRKEYDVYSIADWYKIDWD